MDDIDRKLLAIVAQDPRIQFRQLAKRVGISRQAVHNRLRALTKRGVIKGTMAGVSVSYLEAVPVAISGHFKVGSIDRVLDQLGESEFTHRVVVACGNYIYVIGFLRSISDLDGYVQFVRQTAGMTEPLIGIYSLNGEFMSYSIDASGPQKSSYKELSPLDLRIIGSLRDDARKPVTEVAKMVGVSAKTVRRHLESMLSDGSIEMNVPMDLVCAGDMMLIMHVNLRNGADKREVGRRLFMKEYFHDQYFRTHLNLPNFLAWVFWSDDIEEVRKAVKETSEDEDVESVMLNFAYCDRVYNTTWRDRLADVQFSPSRRPKDQAAE